MSKRTLKKDSDTNPTLQLEFQPLGRRGPSPPGQSLLETARQLEVDLISLCGGAGKCGRCKVQIIEGQTSAPNAAERKALAQRELQNGYRLACQTCADSDLIIYVPPESLSTPQRVELEGVEAPVSPDPTLRGYEVCLSAPSLSDLKADYERLVEGLKRQYEVDCRSTDSEVLRHLSTHMRSWGWKVQAILRGLELIALNPLSSRQLGLAVDLGTTKVAGYLVDLETGQTIASKGIMNPQITYGEDVITRINLARRNADEAERMQKLAVDSINGLAADLSLKASCRLDEIVDAAVVGNTAMHHLLMRLPVDQLARAPHVPSIQNALDIKARELGLCISPGAYLHLPPNIAGFVGADHVAMLLSTEVYRSEGVLLALDIGTNTEICLSNHGDMTCVSCASGPAFEGAHIKFGMRAAPGAIEHMRLVGQHVEYHTIGGVEPVGICGSGVLDAIAQLHLAKMLDKSGRLMGNHPNVRSYEKRREFVLVTEGERGGKPAITITQEDVRELQLAKAAIRAGIQVLLEQKKLSEDDIDQVIVSGAFGSYLGISSAVTIGMLPLIPFDRFLQVGNAAGAGARLVLVSQDKRNEAQRIARQIRYIELASVPNFGKTFLQAISLG